MAMLMRSTIDYVYTQMQLVLIWFSKGRNSVSDEFDAEIPLSDLHQFRAVAVEWVDLTYNHGPFMLMHGDLRPTNIIVNKDLTVVSVIDWEWSRIVPAQLFVPPTWLTGRELAGIRSYFSKKAYEEELVKLRDIVAMHEKETGLLPPRGHPLSQMWSQLELNNSFLIAAGLLSLISIFNTYGDCLDRIYQSNCDRPGRAKLFVKARSHLRREVKRKIKDRAVYLTDLVLHDIAEFEPPTLDEDEKDQSRPLLSDNGLQKLECSHSRMTSYIALFIATCLVGASLFRRRS